MARRLERPLLTVLPAMLLAALLALAAAGCGPADGDDKGAGATPEPTPSGGTAGPGGSGPSGTAGAGNLMWDLSKGHTTRQVTWPAKGTAFELHRGVQVRLVLPAGRTFQGRVERVLGKRDGEVIHMLNFSYRATTTEAAFKQAQALGKEWGIDLRNIDSWYQRRMDQRRQGREDFSDTAFTGRVHAKPLGGPSGPTPSIEMMNSFSDERPVVVGFNITWPR